MSNTTGISNGYAIDYKFANSQIAGYENNQISEFQGSTFDERIDSGQLQAFADLSGVCDSSSINDATIVAISQFSGSSNASSIVSSENSSLLNFEGTATSQTTLLGEISYFIGGDGFVSASSTGLSQIAASSSSFGESFSGIGNSEISNYQSDTIDLYQTDTFTNSIVQSELQAVANYTGLTESTSTANSEFSGLSDQTGISNNISINSAFLQSNADFESFANGSATVDGIFASIANLNGISSSNSTVESELKANVDMTLTSAGNSTVDSQSQYEFNGDGSSSSNSTAESFAITNSSFDGFVTSGISNSNIATYQNSIISDFENLKFNESYNVANIEGVANLTGASNSISLIDSEIISTADVSGIINGVSSSDAVQQSETNQTGSSSSLSFATSSILTDANITGEVVYGIANDTIENYSEKQIFEYENVTFNNSFIIGSLEASAQFFGLSNGISNSDAENSSLSIQSGISNSTSNGTTVVEAFGNLDGSSNGFALVDSIAQYESNISGSSVATSNSTADVIYNYNGIATSNGQSNVDAIASYDANIRGLSEGISEAFTLTDINLNGISNGISTVNGKLDGAIPITGNSTNISSVSATFTTKEYEDAYGNDPNNSTNPNSPLFVPDPVNPVGNTFEFQNFSFTKIVEPEEGGVVEVTSVVYAEMQPEATSSVSDDSFTVFGVVKDVFDMSTIEYVDIIGRGTMNVVKNYYTVSKFSDLPPINMGRSEIIKYRPDPRSRKNVDVTVNYTETLMVEDPVTMQMVEEVKNKSKVYTIVVLNDYSRGAQNLRDVMEQDRLDLMEAA